MKTLADKAQAYLADPWHALRKFPRKVQEAGAPGFATLRRTLRSARRFTLSNEFVTEAIHFASVQPDVILARAVLARLPFPAVWIEFDQEHRVRTQIAIGTSAPDYDGEDRGLGGFLLHREKAGEGIDWFAAGLAAGRGDEGDAFLWPAGQVLGSGREDMAEPPVDLAPVIDEIMLRGWGYRGDAEGIADQTPALVARGGSLPEACVWRPIMDLFLNSPKTEGVDNATKAVETATKESRGDLRFLVTVLALINCAPIRYQHVEPSGRFLHRRNSIAYLDSHVCTIHGTRTHVQRILDERAPAMPGTPRRAHEVRGHWMLAEYRQGVRACRHLPVPELVEGDHAICAKCEKMIVWREHHVRGDAGLGFVTKEYEVER